MNLREQINDQGKEWYNVKCASHGEPAELYIHDYIGRDIFGEGISPEDLINDVKSLKMGPKETLSVHINSKGGDLFDGNTIYNFLVSIKQRVSVVVDGLAASAASIVAMSGDEILIPGNGFIMIHNPHTVVGGDSKEFRKVAADLDQMRDAAVQTYKTRVGNRLSSDEIVAMMDESTWMNAMRSVDLGFATKVIQPVKAAAFASLNLQGYYNNVPEEILATISNARKQGLAERRARRAELNRLKSA